MYYKHRFMKPQAAHCMNTASVEKSSILKSVKNIYRMLITHVTVNTVEVCQLYSLLILEIMNMFSLFMNNAVFGLVVGEDFESSDAKNTGVATQASSKPENFAHRRD